MSKNRIYVYTFIFFFMLCIGIITGSYIVNMNKKAMMEIQTAMNPHTQNSEIEPDLEIEQKSKVDGLVLQMLFDLYTTINASVDTEYAYYNVISQIQNHLNESTTKKAIIIQEASTLLQRSLTKYHTRLTSVKENVNQSLQTFIFANAISSSDQKEIQAALEYLDANISTFAEIGHFILRDKDPFTTKTINQSIEAMVEMTEKRQEAQSRLEKKIGQKLEENKRKQNLTEEPSIRSEDGSVF